MSSILQRVSAFLGFPEATILSWSDRAPFTYRHYYIEKKKGGRRAIYHPAKQTKALQYAIKDTLLVTLPVSEAAAGYVRGVKSPLKKNALIHSAYAYSVRVDFEDFFPSVRPDDLLLLLKKLETVTAKEEKFLRDSLFVFNKSGAIGLAVGAPSSPIISNAVMIDLDKKFLSFAKQNSAVYSRYADDLVYSTDQSGECKDFVRMVRRTLRATKSPSLSINSRKTLYMSRGSRRVVTGLFITPSGGISIGRSQKRYLRKLLYDLKMGKIDDTAAKYLCGYIAYIRDVEPQLFNRLVLKYGSKCLEKVASRRIA